MPLIEELWAGSWIRADFSTWIGENEENKAWQWLARVRNDLEKTTGKYNPDPVGRDKKEEYIELAWNEMFAAEGSDWYWWYGVDQNSGEGDNRWDMLFRNHLTQVYRYLKGAGFEVEIPDIPSLLESDGSDPDLSPGDGTMTPGD